MGRHDDLAGQPGQPFRWHPQNRRVRERILGRAVHDEFIAGELRMAFPFQPEPAEFRAVMDGPRCRRRHPKGVGKFSDMRALRIAQRAV
jgi:hypothetical protein